MKCLKVSSDASEDRSLTEIADSIRNSPSINIYTQP